MRGGLLVGWGLPHQDDAGSFVRWAKAHPTKFKAIPKLVQFPAFAGTGFRDSLEAATHRDGGNSF